MTSVRLYRLRKLVVRIFVSDIADEHLGVFVPPLEMTARKRHEAGTDMHRRVVNVLLSNVAYAFVFNAVLVSPRRGFEKTGYKLTGRGRNFDVDPWRAGPHPFATSMSRQPHTQHPNR